MQLTELIHPVLKRAGLNSNKYAYFDRAAAHIVEKLGLHSKKAKNSQNNYHCREIEKCSWIDGELIDIFEHLPLAQGIEVDSGLSTRFHRLSGKLEWPRFSWASVTSHAVSKHLSEILPRTDNLANIPCRSPLDEWEKHIHWAESGTIIIIGEHTPTEKLSDFLALDKKIQNALSKKAPEIHLIVGYSFKSSCTYGGGACDLR